MDCCHRGTDDCGVGVRRECARRAAAAERNLLRAEGDPGITWTITSQCRPAGCTADIASIKGWRSVAKLVDGRWDFAITKPDGAICADGRYEPAYILMSIDPVTLDGVITNDSNYGCPGGTVTQEPFRLVQVG